MDQGGQGVNGIMNADKRKMDRANLLQNPPPQRCSCIADTTASPFDEQLASSCPSLYRDDPFISVL